MTAAEPSPPWVRFPGSDPYWSGWRQGVSEAWLHGTFLPFWRALAEADRAAYRSRWPAPERDWAAQLERWER